jgi:hypothetical protein
MTATSDNLGEISAFSGQQGVTTKKNVPLGLATQLIEIDPGLLKSV